MDLQKKYFFTNLRKYTESEGKMGGRGHNEDYTRELGGDYSPFLYPSPKKILSQPELNAGDPVETKKQTISIHSGDAPLSFYVTDLGKFVRRKTYIYILVKNIIGCF